MQPNASVDLAGLALNQQQVQRLIATSTGFIDTFVIPVSGDAPMLIPQNIVLSAMNVSAQVSQVEWHEVMLPTYPVHRPELLQVTALVIESDDDTRRFALLCDEMPKTLRLRISTVADIEAPHPPQVYQYIDVEGRRYQIPNLTVIEQKVFAQSR